VATDNAGEALKDSQLSAKVAIFSDVCFGTAGKLFDHATGKITDPAYSGRVERFLSELVWMARA
jgi:hypothetical protein